MSYYSKMEIVSAYIVTKFKVHLVFSNGVTGILDLGDLAGHGVFEAWMEPGFFEQMQLTSFGALSWPGELELCPDSLYLKLTEGINHKERKEHKKGNIKKLKDETSLVGFLCSFA